MATTARTRRAEPPPAEETRAERRARTITTHSRGEKVRALRLGYYDLKRRRIGDVFRISDPAHFSERWMTRVPPNTPERITTGREALKQFHDGVIATRAENQAAGDAGSGAVDDVTDPDPLGDDA